MNSIFHSVDASYLAHQYQVTTLTAYLQSIRLKTSIDFTLNVELHKIMQKNKCRNK